MTESDLFCRNCGRRRSQHDGVGQIQGENYCGGFDLYWVKALFPPFMGDGNGAAVRFLQGWLNGEYAEELGRVLPVTGVLDEETRVFIRHHQRYVGAEVDGMFGQETRRKTKAETGFDFNTIPAGPGDLTRWSHGGEDHDPWPPQANDPCTLCASCGQSRAAHSDMAEDAGPHCCEEFKEPAQATAAQLPPRAHHEDAGPLRGTGRQASAEAIVRSLGSDSSLP